MSKHFFKYSLNYKDEPQTGITSGNDIVDAIDSILTFYDATEHIDNFKVEFIKSDSKNFQTDVLPLASPTDCFKDYRNNNWDCAWNHSGDCILDISDSKNICKYENYLKKCIKYGCPNNKLNHFEFSIGGSVPTHRCQHMSPWDSKCCHNEKDCWWQNGEGNCINIF